MPLDREDTLKKAEKLLRQGRLDAAIAEYARVVEDQPRDWTTANTLGDLYARAGQADKAIGQYVRIADHFAEAGFYPKAAALYKKVLKITPDDETIQLKLADLSAELGLLADARSYLNTVATRRRSRGDSRGVEEIVVRLGDIDPADIDARTSAARVLAARGDVAGASTRFRALYDDLIEKGRNPEALAALREAAQLDPSDSRTRAVLAADAIAAGDVEGVRTYLDRETAGSDPELLAALATMTLRSGDLADARDALTRLLATDPDQHHRVRELARALWPASPDAAYTCIDAVVQAHAAAEQWLDAAAVLQEFLSVAPDHIPSLLKLVEVCVDGGLESSMYEAQVHLTDAYLASGRAAEARVIAEDLVAREPWERAHIERFRRSLVMLRVPEPDSVIADRLSGQSPFMATDPFAAPAPPAAPAIAEPDAPSAETQLLSPPIPEPAEARAVDIPVATELPRAPVAAPGAAAPGRSSGEIDLTSALGELQDSLAGGAATSQQEPADLGEVFAGLRSGGAPVVDHSPQHLKLAETYLEMGLVDEAIAALTTAARSPRARFKAGSTLGRLYRDRGEPARAIEWLEKAAQAPAPTPEEGHALLYDLGVTLDAAGETARALAVFLELLAEAGDYQDASARVDRLARVQTGG